MSTRIFVAKYVPDPARWEPRNIGVIVEEGDARLARFVGEKPGGSIDGRQIRFSVGAPADAYRDWIRYWRRAIDDGSDLVRSGKRDADFFIAEAGETLMEPPGKSLTERLGEYFARLVQDDSAPQEVELKEQVEQFLATTDFVSTLKVERDVAVPASAKGLSEQLKFPYRFINGHSSVGLRVPSGIETLIHDALYRFIAVGESVGRIAFVREFDEAQQHIPALANLTSVASVVDVSRDDAEDQFAKAMR